MLASRIRALLLGSPLPTAEEALQRLTKVKALAVFSGDALSSVTYANEEILLALAVAGSAALNLSFPIALAIAGLLVIVTLSYYQTIHGYPTGGGAYSVARENLGLWPGLVAAASLLIDYVLVVAVSVTAGVAAMTSAFPSLIPHRIELGLVAIALIAWANLRGVRESGTLFAIPTYGFVGAILLLITVGVVRIAAGNLHPIMPAALATPPGGMQAVSLLLALKAFASGCTALTGVEAISNGIPAFEKPESKNAGKTLLVMSLLLGIMFLGVNFLARWLTIMPAAHETVVSQIGRQVFGFGPLYLLLQATTTLILVLAANTAFAGFPRLAAILAHDRYLPRQLTNLGDRLVYANGIIALALMAAALVVVFEGDTHRLIPLFAIGVFLSFTLSQAGMVRHWKKDSGPGWRFKAVINGLGALATAVALSIIAVGKLLHGAWIIILLIPILAWLFYAIHQHYRSVAKQLSLDGLTPEKWSGLASRSRHKVIVPVSGVHRGTLAALRFARTMSKDVTAVAINLEPAVTGRLQEKWSAWGQDIRLVVLESPYRSLIRPLLAFLDETDSRDPERGVAVVVLPEFVTARWWQDLLHNQTARLIKRTLLYRRGVTGKDRVIIEVPFHLRE